MLQKKYRLKKNKHYQYIYNHGEHITGKFVTVYYKKTHFKPALVGFSVTSKIGNAVERNRIRRRLKAVAYNIYPLLNQNYNYVIVARTNECIDVDFELLQKSVLECFKKGKLTNEKGV